jgi:hypothetical protein
MRLASRSLKEEARANAGFLVDGFWGIGGESGI